MVWSVSWPVPVIKAFLRLVQLWIPHNYLGALTCFLSKGEIHYFGCNNMTTEVPWVWMNSSTADDSDSMKIIIQFGRGGFELGQGYKYYKSLYAYERATDTEAITCWSFNCEWDAGMAAHGCGSRECKGYLPRSDWISRILIQSNGWYFCLCVCGPLTHWCVR